MFQDVTPPIMCYNNGGEAHLLSWYVMAAMDRSLFGNKFSSPKDDVITDEVTAISHPLHTDKEHQRDFGLKG